MSPPQPGLGLTLHIYIYIYIRIYIYIGQSRTSGMLVSAGECSVLAIYLICELINII